MRGIAERLVNPEALLALYGELPAQPSGGVRIRSLNLNWRGPTVTLRVDLPAFPQPPPPAWVEEGVDTVQCQLEFLAVERISLGEWDPPAVSDIDFASFGSERRMRVALDGDGVSLGFECSEFVTLGHVSAFRGGDDGSDGGRHLFVSKVDARRYRSLPGTEEKTFYGR
ncbi:Imm50 family immunity protein [Streptomyces sp. NPDC046915]|uniref:Imm50 family immunity protein n=1 Tax=Streptomyces sp. NPDC046915 TaxID=3155257 RepID=UPI0033F6FF24